MYFKYIFVSVLLLSANISVCIYACMYSMYVWICMYVRMYLKVECLFPIWQYRLCLWSPTGCETLSTWAWTKRKSWTSSSYMAAPSRPSRCFSSTTESRGIFHTYIQTYIHTYIHTYILYIHTHTCFLTLLRAYKIGHEYITIYIHTYTHTYIHTYIYCIHAHTHIHTYIHTYIQIGLCALS